MEIGDNCPCALLRFGSVKVTEYGTIGRKRNTIRATPTTEVPTTDLRLSRNTFQRRVGAELTISTIGAMPHL